MHTVTVCPRCKEEFMYHNTDYHLIRNNMPPNTGGLGLSVEDLKEQDFEYVICQDCDFFEKWVHKEVKIKEGNAHEHLNKFRLFVDDIEKNALGFTVTVKIGDTNSYEYFADYELEIV